MSNGQKPNDPGNYKAVLKRFAASQEDIRTYFEALPDLIKDYVYEVSIAYLFFKIERGHRRTLFGGVVKRFNIDTDLAEKAIFDWQMKREEFESQFHKVFDQPLSTAALTDLKRAEATRDHVMHGRMPDQAEMRSAISAVIDYAEQLNSQVANAAAFRPFGNMRGFKGAKTPLDKRTSRWVLKGLGFPIS